jgi:hypothetical protein
MLQDSNAMYSQQMGLDASASVEGFSPGDMMAGTPQDWVEPRGSSVEVRVPLFVLTRMFPT